MQTDKPRLRWCGTGQYFGWIPHEIGAWIEIKDDAVHVYVPPAFLIEGRSREACFPFDRAADNTHSGQTVAVDAPQLSETDTGEK